MALGHIPAERMWTDVVHWWRGDSLGIVLVTPIVLVWRRAPSWPPRRILETLALLGLSFVVGQVVFLDWLPNIFGLVSRGYWLYVIVAWGAVRLGLHGVLAMLLLLVFQALIGAVRGVVFSAKT
jgi:integral membrane sensor domain MASE1